MSAAGVHDLPCFVVFTMIPTQYNYTKNLKILTRIGTIAHR